MIKSNLNRIKPEKYKICNFLKTQKPSDPTARGLIELMAKSLTKIDVEVKVNFPRTLIIFSDRFC
ncbi:hypothetical protein L2E65_02145 [Planktothrix agardhii 1801]|jgi:hypothetical protein|uniref:hypothetical protein n=1 Tax=Planktothrix agardhii TaxID=1160 RepID=UPI001F3A1418|nr:hypothetical protein [Planktothrix agardhii]MCF3623600.1 hypothetical protein [Planktothrix agardhii 1801]